MLAIEYGYTDVVNRLVEHRVGLDATDQASCLLSMSPTYAAA
jgi:hypothetical protein